MNQRFRRRITCLCRATAVLAVLGVAASPASAEEIDYSLPDPELRLVRIDNSPGESFLGVELDTAGRLFVGGREALFVYEPDNNGGYGPRQELYRFPDHTWIYNIAIRGNDVYVLTVAALYVIPDAVTKREGLKPKRLIWGVPLGHVHQCFHGMAWGPEGDLYFAMGDPLWYYGDFDRPDHWGHWTFFSQPEGTRTPYTGVGGVFRCKPDGSGFQIVARGLRNPCGLAFDDHWNLFTNDNDHEGIPAEYVPGRLLHVTPHSYFGWPRGWMPEKTPDRADLLQTMFPGMGRGVPVGQTYYNDAFLPEKYRNNLLVARWGKRTISRYPLKPRGASFETEEFDLLVGRNHARPVGVAVGRGGRIFATISYMAHNEGSPVYPSDLVMITRADDPPTHPFEGYEAAEASAEKLAEELASTSWCRGYRAHIEVLRRGGEALENVISILWFASGNEVRATIQNLVWLLGESQDRQGVRAFVRSTLEESVTQGKPESRLQALRALTEFSCRETPRMVFLKALKDPDAQVRHAAVLAFFKLDGPLPDEIIEGPARSDDTYLRQAATLLLAEKATLEQLAAWSESDDSATRLAAVLAMGFRLTLPAATEPIPDDLPLEPHRSEDVYKIQFADATVDLRDFGRVGNFTTADHWNAREHAPEQERLFALLRARLGDADEQVRLQAAHFLYLLNDPRTEPEIAKVRTATDERRLATAPIHAIGRAWVVGPFDDGGEGFERVHPPEQGAVDLSAEYRNGDRALTWQQAKVERVYEFDELFGVRDGASCYAYARLESPRRQLASLLVGSNDGIRVWQNGNLVWDNDVERGALPFQDVLTFELEPGSNDLLFRVRNLTGASGLYLHYRSLGSVADHLPEKVDARLLADRLRAAAEGKVVPLGPEFLEVDWDHAAGEGNAENGRNLFATLACVKCHAVSADGPVTGGPSLAEARQRFTVSHLVESILLPNKQVSPIFQATLIVTDDGRQHTGLVLGETAEKIDLLLTDTNRETIPKTEIDERKLLETSPMPQGVVKIPEELRDLLAFLLAGQP